ncbi:MAG: DUF4142 domain-containing protein, partial [Bacillota bacterium]
MAQHKHRMHTFGIAMLAIMFGAGSAYAQQSSSQSATDSARSPSSGSASAAGGSTSSTSSADKLSASDQAMMKQLAMTNMAEIEAAKIALNKSKDEQVRNFAQKMVDDHTQATKQLQDLAQAKGVALPDNLDAKHKAEIDKLSALSGDKFDKTYMTQGGVSDHRQAHALLSRIEKQAKDNDLKQLASNMMPKIN